MWSVILGMKSHYVSIPVRNTGFEAFRCSSFLSPLSNFLCDFYFSKKKIEGKKPCA